MPVTTNMLLLLLLFIPFLFLTANHLLKTWVSFFYNALILRRLAKIQSFCKPVISIDLMRFGKTDGLLALGSKSTSDIIYTINAHLLYFISLSIYIYRQVLIFTFNLGLSNSHLLFRTQ